MTQLHDAALISFDNRFLLQLDNLEITCVIIHRVLSLSFLNQAARNGHNHHHHQMVNTHCHHNPSYRTTTLQ
jgi:hypothetical protein